MSANRGFCKTKFCKSRFTCINNFFGRFKNCSLLVIIGNPNDECFAVLCKKIEQRYYLDLNSDRISESYYRNMKIFYKNLISMKFGPLLDQNIVFVKFFKILVRIKTFFQNYKILFKNQLKNQISDPKFVKIALHRLSKTVTNSNFKFQQSTFYTTVFIEIA